MPRHATLIGHKPGQLVRKSSNESRRTFVTFTTAEPETEGGKVGWDVSARSIASL